MRRRANFEFDVGVLHQRVQSAGGVSMTAGESLANCASDLGADPLTVLYAALYQGVLVGNLCEEISLNMTVEFSDHPGEKPWLWHALLKTS
jgi:hypothetical protein